MNPSASTNPSIGDVPRNYVMVVAIDFGTTFSGYAFSFKTKPSDIIMSSTWGVCLGIQGSYKTATCVLTNTKGRFEAFGYEAQHKFSCFTPDEAKNFNFFEKFKMHLHNKNLNRDMKLTSHCGRTQSALEIFGMSLKALKEHVLKTIKSQTDSVPSHDSIQWVVTVPAIWSDASKQFMREAAWKGGLIDSVASSQLIIALEPEAASLYCRQTNMQLSPYSFEQSKMAAGTKYLVLDCGGGTLDVTAHKLLPDKKIAELYHANGGSLGGSQIDLNFIELLNKIFGRNVIHKFKTDCPAGWLQMLLNFERMKRSVNPEDTKQTVNIQISFEFAECYQKLTGKSVKDCINIVHKLKGLSFVSGMLRLPYNVMEQLFAPVVEGILSHVQALMTEPDLKDITHFLLVGGFGECLLLQSALKKAFGNKIKLIVPADAGLCVLKGAVLYGHSPGDIAERITRKTYGTNVTRDFDPKVHDVAKKEIYDGVAKAYPVFSIFVRRGEKISTGETRSFSFTPATAGQKTASSSIYQTDKVNPTYTDENGVDEVGKICIELPGGGIEREIEYRITFGGTELLVQARDPRPGGDVARTSVDFLSQ